MSEPTTQSGGTVQLQKPERLRSVETALRWFLVVAVLWAAVFIAWAMWPVL